MREETPPPGYVPLEVPELWEPEAPAPAYPPVPRSFDELRRSPSLAGREFADLSQLAVAAVVEAGHDPVGIARLFRVPGWKLQQWLDAGARPAPADPGPYVPPRR